MRKQGFSSQELQLLQGELEKRQKSTIVAWLLWLFLGGLGGHRYYMGSIGMGIAMTLTLGGLGLWSLIDAFFIMGRLRKVNGKIEEKIITEIESLRGRSQAASSRA